VNATRILLRGPDGHLHLMKKALANGLALLLLAADLTVTQARWKPTGVLSGNKDSTSRPGVPATLSRSPAG
jgi:hypothetical protein